MFHLSMGASIQENNPNPKKSVLIQPDAGRCNSARGVT
jgi:hypothetical protein